MDTSLGPNDLTLVVGSSRNGQNTANVTLKWQLSERLAKQLLTQEVRSPCMLIVVSDGRRDGIQQYKLVPLKTGFTFLSLRAIGTNTIHATIVWQGRDADMTPRHAIGKIKVIYDTMANPRISSLYAQLFQVNYEIGIKQGTEEEPVLKTEASRLNRLISELYDQPVVTINRYLKDIDRLDFESVIDVNVPKEMFAPDPSPIIKWLANKGSRGRKIDQCDMRKYVLLGLSYLALIAVTSPARVAVWVLWKLVELVIVGALLFVGKRGIDFEPLFSWGWTKPNQIYSHLQRSVWLYKKHEPSLYRSTFELRSAIFFWLNPPAIVITAIIVWITWVSGIAWIAAIVGGAFGAFILASTLSMHGNEAARKARLEAFKKRQEAAKERREVERQSVLEQNLTQLVSTEDNSGNRVVEEELRPVRQTVTLLFDDAKSWVCLPFAEK